MAQKYYNVAEAAKKLGVSPAEINQMVLRRELYGYRDGADWKFKTEDIDRAAAERGAAGARRRNQRQRPGQRNRAGPVRSGPLRHRDRRRPASPANPDSDIHLASDVKLAGERSLREEACASDLNLLESDFNLAGSHAGGSPSRATRPPGSRGSKTST